MSADIAIIAAMEREVWPLVRGWSRRTLDRDGWSFTGFTRGSTLVVCSGIGAEPARRAAVAVFASECPRVVISAGFAGALDRNLCVAQVFTPSSVVDMKTGARYAAARGNGVLVSASSILQPEGKHRLAGSFAAQAADMEAAPVALVAAQHACPFLAIKAISEDLAFPLPDFGPFIDQRGRLHTARYVLAATWRPGEWPRIARLARNTFRARLELCRALAHLIEEHGAAESCLVLPGKN